MNRLGLAQWLVSPGHPLTARVAVNRFWQQFFGTGIVATSEDFGTQGEWPSHPKLLDWLAVEFRENGWDVKRLMKRLVHVQHVPTVGPRLAGTRWRRTRKTGSSPEDRGFRMDAEMIRDQALFVSGLLVETDRWKVVKPYQPTGLWNAVGYTRSNTANFVQDRGDALYRRSLYTFWKRTSPPPTMSILDAPTREACTARRARTNTPLAALASLNDVQFVEAARHLAQRAMTEGGAEPTTGSLHVPPCRLPTDRPRKNFPFCGSSTTGNSSSFRATATRRENSCPEEIRPATSPSPHPTTRHGQWCELVLNLDEVLNK